MKQPDDLLLITRVVLFGDKKAFEKLVVMYQSKIRRFLLHLTSGNKELSDDLSQEVFIKVYLNLSSFRGTARFSTWLYRISYNTFNDYLKKTNHEDPEDDVYKYEGHLYNEISENLNIKIDINESLKILREVEKTAVLLFYMEDMSHEKIAFIMNCPVGTVKSYILRGRDKLALYFKNSGYDR